jgi:trehalose 6-phosphate synthase/phosphatase
VKQVAPRTVIPYPAPFRLEHINVFLFNYYLTFVHHTLCLTLTTEQKLSEEGAEFAELPRPLGLERQESGHSGHRPSLMNVPLTPGIHLGEYASEGSTAGSISYFSHDISKLRNQMAQSPSDATSGAKFDCETLHRMSLASGLQRRDSLADIDPRAADPSLGLSGGIISANFCIQHSLQYRKGADWVREFIVYILS